MKNQNKVLSRVIYLVMLLVAIGTVKGKVNGNIIEIVITMLVYVTLLKLSTKALSFIQKDVTTLKEILGGPNEKRL